MWLNGARLGEIRGAFIRGVFDVSSRLRAGEPNALVVRISPVPHPGIPHEESLKAGAGPNGGAMLFDGPTFFCTEGWDWIPGIRDRVAGIWQDVVLHVGGPVRIGDVQVETDLPLPDTTTADVTVKAALENRSAERPEDGRARGVRGRVVREARVPRPRREDRRRLLTRGVAPLRVAQPAPVVAERVRQAGALPPEADGPRRWRARLRREGRALRHPGGQLRALRSRRPGRGAPLRAVPDLRRRASGSIDKRHAALRETPARLGADASPRAARDSPAVRLLDDSTTAPFLVIRVNGKRVVGKGGNWGLDDAMKRVARERLEPFFRMERDANLTMIRNWCGQSTEEVFFDLADEYGLMVWNDFWTSTENWNLQPGDLDLWLANAEDTIKRFRNHPSIVIWCGRNEGVPPPYLNEGLDALVREHDGTRYYQPNSIKLNLDDSGPWVWATRSTSSPATARASRPSSGCPPSRPRTRCAP